MKNILVYFLGGRIVLVQLIPSEGEQILNVKYEPPPQDHMKTTRHTPGCSNGYNIRGYCHRVKFVVNLGG